MNTLSAHISLIRCIVFGCIFFSCTVYVEGICTSDLCLCCFNRTTNQCDYVNASDASGAMKYYDSSKRTMIFTHGWTENSTGLSARLITEAFIPKNYNIYCLDWGTYSNMLWYPNSANKVPYVASALAGLIASMKDLGLNILYLHVIGFSFGAQISGAACRNLTQNGITIERLTGIDAARVCFELQVQLVCALTSISAKDAKLVEAIHTSGGQLGMLSPYGLYDFYVNGGTLAQCGCPVSAIVDLLAYPANGVLTTLSCDHYRAVYCYCDAIVNDAMTGLLCNSSADFILNRCAGNSVAPMGLDLTLASTPGRYELQTNPVPRYGRGLAGTIYNPFVCPILPTT